MAEFPGSFVGADGVCLGVSYWRTFRSTFVAGRRLDLAIPRRVAVLILVSGVIGHAQTSTASTGVLVRPNEPFRVAVSGARPLWSAVRALEAQYGWAINYEDPPYSGSEVVEDVRPLPPGGVVGLTPHFVPRRGQIDVTVRGTEGPARAIQALIDDNNQRQNPGEFQLQTLTGNRFTLLPTHGDILDAPISVTEKDWTLDELLSAIVENLRQTRSTPIHGPGMISSGAGQRFRLGAENESARSILLRAVQMRTGNLPLPLIVWDLRYAPNWGYVLETHSVKMKVGLPDRSFTLKQLVVPDHN